MARMWKGAIFKPREDRLGDDKALLGTWELTDDDSKLAAADDNSLIFASTAQDLYQALLERFPDADALFGQVVPPRQGHEYAIRVMVDPHYLGDPTSDDVERIRGLARKHKKVPLNAHHHYFDLTVLRERIDCSDVILHGQNVLCNPKLAKAKRAKKASALVTSPEIKDATYALLKTCRESSSRAAIMARLMNHYSGIDHRAIVREFFGTLHFLELVTSPTKARKHPAILDLRRAWARSPEANATKYREALKNVEGTDAKEDQELAEELIVLLGAPQRSRKLAGIK